MNNEVLNSEILFIYDCKGCNPNGDPDNENKPRMDLLKEKVLVSDVRLKRYIRDFFQNIKEKPIFVSKVDDKTVDATDRFAYFIAELLLNDEKYKDKLKKLTKENKISRDELVNLIKGNDKENDKKNKKNHWDLIDIDDFLNYFIDVRLFGVTLPIKDAKRGSSITFTGPVQFNWGYTLNKTELIESPSITSHFAGRIKGEGEEGGAIGKDWKIYYGVISFYGRVSGNSAKRTNLTNEDIKLLDEAIWKSIITETNTRTKIGQHPLFYLRVEFNDKETYIGDLRRYIDIDKKEGLRDIVDFKLNIGKLVEKFKNFEIKKIVFKKSDDVSIEEIETLKKEFQNKIEEL
ncbi:CRISPR-associated protein Csh2 [Thermotomaculum hydrothermale]|uniref:CRISPR-associated protein Csh2 n=1 Tax=Thermotomaculum hydrothermale TaxID=981385 RepID=A0A7R6PY91_9BACT|nr:type I-B CRISPR-associated protein Cas7/Csh2 [Thermotomaculum hydrothermale]BBB31813.1 CRISPR-associated protein Csh2 [Thermotomaculum hydrothermale]